MGSNDGYPDPRNFSKLPKARGSSSFTGFPKSRNPRDSELLKARSSGSFTDLPKSRDPRDSDHVLDHILESDSSDESRPLGTQRQECGSATGSRGFFFRRDPSPLAASRSSPLTPCLTSHPLQSPPISSDLVFRRLLPALLAAPCKYYTCLLACLLARSCWLAPIRVSIYTAGIVRRAENRVSSPSSPLLLRALCARIVIKLNLLNLLLG